MNATSSYLNQPPREHAEVYGSKPGKRTLSPLEAELLAALKFCAEALAVEAPIYKAHIEQARAAIAKAQGR